MKVLLRKFRLVALCFFQFFLLVNSSRRLDSSGDIVRDDQFYQDRYNKMRRLYRHRFTHSPGVSVRFLSNGFSNVRYGPNTCGSSCCRGWTTSSKGYCTQPVCVTRCQNGGVCVSPNTCQCQEGFFGQGCEIREKIFSAYHTVMLNDAQQRKTRQSLVTHRLNRPKITSYPAYPSTSFGLRYSSSVSPARSYLIMRSRYGRKLGKCYRKIRTAMCGVAFNGFMTADICCRGRGDAWGPTCKPCTSIVRGGGSQISGEPTFEVSCPSGFKSIFKKCQDVIIDSFNYDIFEYNAETRIKNGWSKAYENWTCGQGPYVNECFELPSKCDHGRCVNLVGSYRCRCQSGYRLSSNEKSCLRRKTSPRESSKCYLRVTIEGTCENLTLIRGSKFSCCCSVGVAWGNNCEMCPNRGSDERRKLCSLKPGNKRIPIDSAKVLIVDDHRYLPHHSLSGSSSAPFPSLLTAILLTTATTSRSTIPATTSLTTKQPTTASTTVPVSVTTSSTTTPPTTRTSTATTFPSSTATTLETTTAATSSISTMSTTTSTAPTQTTLSTITTTTTTIPSTTTPDTTLITTTPTTLITTSSATTPEETTSTSTTEITSPSTTTLATMPPTTFTSTTSTALSSPTTTQSTQTIPSSETSTSLTAPVITSTATTSVTTTQATTASTTVPVTVTTLSTSRSPTTHTLTTTTLPSSTATTLETSTTTATLSTTTPHETTSTSTSLSTAASANTSLTTTPTTFVSTTSAASSPSTTAQPIQSTSSSETLVFTAIIATTSLKVGSGSIDDNDDDQFRSCYFDSNTCKNEMVSNITEQTCCCTLGKAWGDCKSCPKMRTEEYRSLCPYGRGFANYGKLPRSVDIDECKVFKPEQICPNARCINTIGAFECRCHRGYYYDKRAKACKDFNECLYRNRCGNAKCKNLPGSFRCVCPPGNVLRRRADGATCIYVGLLLSSSSAIATSTTTSFDRLNRPRIKPTASGKITPESPLVDSVASGSCFARATSNRICYAKFSKDMSFKSCCCMAGKAWGPKCLACPRRRSQQYKALCFSMPERNDEQSDRSCGMWGNCNNGICVRRSSGLFCQCNSGYKFNRENRSCEDVNECVASATYRPCIVGGRCINNKGSFKCKCFRGYRRSSSKQACIRSYTRLRYRRKRYYA